MKKVELIMLLFLSLGLIYLAVTIHIYSDKLPTLNRLERSQKIYDNFMANPTPVSEECVKRTLENYLEGQKSLKSFEESLRSSDEHLSHVLLIIGFVQIAISIIIYRRGKKHQIT